VLFFGDIVGRRNNW